MDRINDERMTTDAKGAELSRGQGISAWRQIADEIANEIASGILRPQSQLPTEAALSLRFGVNRHTVRRALAALAEKGLVRATRGSGTFVEARPLPYPIGERTRFSEIVSRAGRESHGALVASREVAAEERVAAALGIAPGSPVLELTTIHRADGTPISTSLAWFPLPRLAGFAERYAALASITRAFADFGIPDYLRLSTRITARAASADEAARLELASGRVVMLVESVNTDPQGAPIQATRAAFAADRVECLVES